MIQFEAAQRAVIESCAPLGTESSSLADAVGRVLGKTLRAETDLVPFARSAMDGFALRSVDTASETALPIRSRIFAEQSTPIVHEACTATEIATGAPIPWGADAVVPVEHVVRENGAIRLHSTVSAGANVFPPGEDAHAGDTLLSAGHRLSAADAGLLAASGNAQVEVFVRPRVAIVTSGDEVVEPGVRPAHGQIRNSNAALLSATLQRWGCRIVSCVHAGDDEGLLRSRLSEALANCDLLVTTGGASVGERDFMKGLLRQLGATFVFDSVALRPAKPSAFARYENVRVAVLPGNPSSAFVALHELVRLAALTLSGESEVALPRLEARLEGRLHGKAQRTYAAYASLHIASDGFVATPLDNQCSALTRTASEAAGFIIAPPGRHEYEPGDRVLVDVVDWSKLNH